jgi:hypothetical protein
MCKSSSHDTGSLDGVFKYRFISKNVANPDVLEIIPGWISIAGSLDEGIRNVIVFFKNTNRCVKFDQIR